jgi:hypothetical protein
MFAQVEILQKTCEVCFISSADFAAITDPAGATMATMPKEGCPGWEVVAAVMNVYPDEEFEQLPKRVRVVTLLARVSSAEVSGDEPRPWFVRRGFQKLGTN